MNGPVAAVLDGGARLHLQHGPIDLIIGADAQTSEARQRAFAAAAERFETVLGGLVVELEHHRRALGPDTPLPADLTARRMYRAVHPFCKEEFVTPMIAVAGSVADEVLAAMLEAGPLRRAYVNNGGDIAVHLAPEQMFSVAMVGLVGGDLGRVRFGAAAGIGGIATSGSGGRSLSLGIADSVTVLARSASEADVAATLIANAVDLPGHSAISRAPADTLHPDTDLGARLVVTATARLSASNRARALDAGLQRANAYLKAGHILGAALFLQGDTAQTGDFFDRRDRVLETNHA